jgi:pSer/pThr/pTyr-binding forkhead associated (FHA) protein
MSPLRYTLLVRPLCASWARAYAFEHVRVAIGRSPENDLPLANGHRAVSRRHAEIRLVGGRPHLVDLGSKNATFLNGRPLSPGRPRPLRSGDRIVVGDFELEVVVPEPSADAPA